MDILYNGLVAEFPAILDSSSIANNTSNHIRVADGGGGEPQSGEVSDPHKLNTAKWSQLSP